MTAETPSELLEKGFISRDQHERIDLVNSGKIVSLFYELRSILYLGVMLFTTGVGILIYQNIGESGHLIAIISLSFLAVLCFWYVFTRASPYTNGAVTPPTPYFDYIVLLGSMLFISVQGYLQFRFGLLDENLGLSTLVSSVFFFYIAYRYDHLGILSLAITALASFWSISISPRKWYSGDFFSASHLYVTAVVFSIVLAVIAIALDKRAIKKHFTFTYLNFSLLIFFAGAITGLFVEESVTIYLPLIFAGSGFSWYVARQNKSFIFLLYAFIAVYIGTTYFLAITVIDQVFELWFLYSFASCGAFIYFIIKYKNYFTRHS
jgi:hypothetical protein